MKIDNKTPLLYLVIHQRLLKLQTRSQNIRPTIDFARFRSVISGYFRVRRELWFRVAKEMEDFGLIKIHPNAFIRLNILSNSNSELG